MDAFRRQYRQNNPRPSYEAYRAQADENSRAATQNRETEQNRLRAGAYDALLEWGLNPGGAENIAGALDWLPGVGDVSGAEDTYQLARAGEYLPAALSGVGTAIGTLPVVGDAASYALRELAPAAGAGILAGKNALTANLADLFRAEDMKAAGWDRDERYDLTGWDLDNVDGKPRFEIPDTYAQFSPALREPGAYRLKDVMAHPDLYKAYPSLRNMRVDVLPEDDMDGSLGWFRPGSASMSLREGMPLEGPNSVRDVLPHEIQHAVQDLYEGFMPGGSPDNARVDLLGALNDRTNATRLARKDVTGNLYEDVPAKTNAPGGDLFALEMALRNAEWDVAAMSGHGVYRRLPGENEAFNVGDRATGLSSPGARFYETQRYADDEQLYASKYDTQLLQLLNKYGLNPSKYSPELLQK